MSRDPNPFLRAMLEAAAKVISYTNGLNQSEFVANSIIYDAVLRNLEIIGEAAKRVPQNVRDATPNVPWRMICGFRDHLAHGYFGLDDDLVWEVISEEIPARPPVGDGGSQDGGFRTWGYPLRNMFH